MYDQERTTNINRKLLQQKSFKQCQNQNKKHETEQYKN